MIKPDELRIGNMLDGLIVGNITETGINFSDANEGYTEIPFESLKPIPLTEAWLLDFGYKKIGFQYILSLNYHLIGDEKRGFLVCRRRSTTGKPTDDIIPCQYVHHLQNAHFDITQEELTL